MGSYRHLSREDREQIAVLRAASYFNAVKSTPFADCTSGPKLEEMILIETGFTMLLALSYQPPIEVFKGPLGPAATTRIAMLRSPTSRQSRFPAGRVNRPYRAWTREANWNYIF